MTMMQVFWPVVAAVLGTIAFCIYRAQAHAASAARVAQLDDAASLLTRHAQALEVFLDDQDAPMDLKHLLISLSDAMADPETVARLAEWVASRPADASVDTPEAEALVALLSSLNARRPDLFEVFVTGIWTAVAGAALRWPASAAIDRMLARMVSSPRRDVSIAVTATSFRSGTPFSIKVPAAAVA